CLLITAFKFSKKYDGKQGFWIKTLSVVTAIVMPQFIIQCAWALGSLNKLTYVVMISCVVVLFLMILVFLINLVFWKLKNRKVMMLSCAIAICMLLVNARIISAIIPFSVSYFLNQYNDSIVQLENYNKENGTYPKTLDIEQNTRKFKDYYYKTFNDGKAYALYVAVGQGVWSHCSDINAAECTPEKWLFNKDGSRQWLEIPEWFSVHKMGDSHKNTWTTWVISRAPVKK
ncbi:MAG: hypothetical protein ACI37T_03465, partial [Candidatus Gastranaerophilaceae bacterium]